MSRRVLAAIVIVAALAVAPTGSPHTGWCGHQYKEFYEDTPQGLTRFREVFQWGYNQGGAHYHVIDVHRYAPYRPPGDRWVFVHNHSNRQCPAHAN